MLGIEKNKIRIIPQKTFEMKKKERAAKQEKIKQLYQKIDSKIDKLIEKFERDIDNLK